MAPPVLYPVKKLIAITPEAAQAIEDYRFANRLKTEAEAIRRLIDAGLKAANLIRNPKPGGGSAEKPSGQPVKPARSSTRRTPKAAPVSKEAQLRALREQGARST